MLRAGGWVRHSPSAYRYLSSGFLFHAYKMDTAYGDRVAHPTLLLVIIKNYGNTHIPAR